MAEFLELSFDLGALDAHTAESAAFACGAFAVTFVDARDDAVDLATKSQASGSPLGKTADFAATALLEPAPGEMPLWPASRVKCLFAPAAAGERNPQATVAAALAAALGIDASQIGSQTLADRAWEREWLKDVHAMRFGRRLWVCPHHERVSTPEAVIVTLDPGLAFGTGTHASTALCLAWLDAHLRAGACVIDYGCGSGVLGIAAARLGAAEVHAYDIDPQALIATADNARANEVQARLQVHASAAALPAGADLLLANILAAPLCVLAPRFAALLRPGGQVVLAGLMAHEVAEVTAAYGACFDVARFGERAGWACLSGQRR
jgi:ribosomal protein L11 methyltransferase